MECLIVFTFIRRPIFTFSAFRYGTRGHSWNRLLILPSTKSHFTRSVSETHDRLLADRSARLSSRYAAAFHAMSAIIAMSNSTWRTHVFLGRPRGHLIPLKSASNPVPGASMDRPSAMWARTVSESRRTSPNTASRLKYLCGEVFLTSALVPLYSFLYCIELYSFAQNHIDNSHVKN